MAARKKMEPDKPIKSLGENNWLMGVYRDGAVYPRTTDISYDELKELFERVRQLEADFYLIGNKENKDG